MKARLTACALALSMALSLSGCSPLLQRSYSSSVDHVEYTQSEDSSILRAESYRGLVDAILYFVNDHAGEGVVRLYNYTGDVDKDLESACREVLQDDPLAAFAVEDISCDFSRIVSYYEVAVTLTYSHTVEEVDAIQFAAGSSTMRQMLRQAMADFAPSLALRVSYFPGDENEVRAMAVQAYYDTPQAAFGLPQIQVSIYPESGVQRIVEIHLKWSETQSELSGRSAQLLTLAQELLDSDPPQEESYTPEELELLLRQAAAPMDPDGAGDPYSALSGESANELGHALALELLLQLAGLETTLVSGQADQEEAWWLIVSNDTSSRHLLLTDEEPTLYTDLELTGLGYLWNTENYPACVSEGEPPSAEPTEEPLPPGGDTGDGDDGDAFTP